MASTVHRRATLGLALCAALTVSGCLGYEGDFDRGYQVDEDSVSQVKVGATTKPEALALLGKLTRHIIECIGELSDFVARVNFHASLPASRGDFTRARGKLFDRARDAR